MSQLVTTNQKVNNLRQLIGQNLKAIGAVLPSMCTPERMARIALSAATREPKLLDCTPESFVRSMLEASVLGLEPGVAGQCWILPYKDQAQLVLGYKGLVHLCWRSGQISNIGAEAVYEKDVFEYEKFPPRLVHKPHRGEDRGPLVAAYAYAKLQNGGEAWCVLEAHEVMSIKKRSPGSKKESSPWNSKEDEHWMWRKTALRQLVKLLPMSVEVQRAVDNDERADIGLPQQFDPALDPANEVRQAESVPVSAVSAAPVSPAPAPKQQEKPAPAGNGGGKANEFA